MTEREFVERFINDKAFKREVAGAVMDYEGDENSETGMADWMAYAAASMGHQLDVTALDKEINEQVGKLSTLQKIMFLGSFINAGRKNKKAKEKAERRAAKNR